MDNKDYEELKELDNENYENEEQFDYVDDFDEIEEIPSEEIYENNNNYDFNNQNLQNQIRKIKNQNKANQNTINKLRQRKANTISKGVEAPKSTPSTSNIPKLENPFSNLGSSKGLGKEAASKVGKTAAQAGKAAGKAAGAAGKAAAQGISSAITALVANPYFWIAVGVILLIMLIPVLWGAYDSDESDSGSNDNRNSNISSNVESEISLTKTNLSKNEFVASCNTYSEQDTNHKFFYDKCDEIYDISISNNFNPEMVVIRAIAEGFSPGTSRNNYWGIGCYNGAGVNACIKYSSFSEGVKGFIDNVSQYATVEEMMSKYSFIGYNWYNPGSPSEGGCYYFPYIKKYMSAGRIITVQNACSEGKICVGTMCEPTNDEDQLAYSKWQVSKMVTIGNNVFGSVTSQDATPSASSSEMPTSVADLKLRYYFIYDKEKYLRFEDINDHLFGQCVWYAYHRAMDIVNSSNLSEEEKNKRITSLQSHSSDGGQYVTAMDGAVFKKTTNINDIKAPAVISWKNNSYGHVAIVESIKIDENGNKVFVISEGWRTKDCNGGNDWCSHDSIEELWNVTNFNSYSSSSVNTYNRFYSFVNAASLLE